MATSDRQRGLYGDPTADPFTGIYAISKLAIMGITSSSIEPGAMDTPMTADHQANLEKTWSRMPSQLRENLAESVIRKALKLNPGN